MKIRTKTLGLMALAVLVSAVANLLILRAVVFPSFVAMEKSAAERDMQRVVEAINSTIDNLDAIVNDYAKWDTTYNYSLHNNIDYIKENITPDGLERLKIRIIGIYGPANVPLVEAFFDFDKDELEPAGELAFSVIDKAKRLFYLHDVDAVVKGIVSSPRGPVIAASRPILKTSGEGPIAGAFVFGQLFDAEAEETLRRQTKVDFNVTVLDGSPVPAVESQLRDILKGGKEIGTEEAEDGSLHGYALVRDIYGEPAILLRADIRRDISSIGRDVLLVSVLGMLLAGVVVMAATALLLQWLVLGPIGEFTGHVLAIGRNGDISRRLGLNRADELGLLGREFDAMLENLAQARNRLLDQSYRSGIAEMASGVLHNIRNQVAPLAMRLGRLREETAGQDDDKIDRALDELLVASVPADRKAKIAKYIRMAMRVEKDDRCKTAEQLTGLVDDFVRLKNVLQDMDHFSRGGFDEVESTLLHDVVQETIAMLPTFPDVQMAIKVDATLQALPPVLGKSFALRHILHNVMINAVEAIAASSRPRGELRISASVLTIDRRGFVELRLHDDGIGIAEETLPKIFGRGFSTKKGERRGSGLHWSANCIAAIGGKIVAESEGVGHGTTFRLTLPLALPATEAAA